MFLVVEEHGSTCPFEPALLFISNAHGISR